MFKADFMRHWIFTFCYCYTNTHPERRMAICEEIERKIVIDDVTLSRFREHLSLEEILNTWVV